MVKMKQYWVYVARGDESLFWVDERRDLDSYDSKTGAQMIPVYSVAATDGARAHDMAIVWYQIDQGMHDVYDGSQPIDVIEDRDGDIAVCYRATVEGGIPWENKVKTYAWFEQ